jgi:hypothetical protein
MDALLLIAVLTLVWLGAVLTLVWVLPGLLVAVVANAGDRRTPTAPTRRTW